MSTKKSRKEKCPSREAALPGEDAGSVAPGAEARVILHLPGAGKAELPAGKGQTLPFPSPNLRRVRMKFGASHVQSLGKRRKNRRKSSTGELHRRR